MLPQLYWQSACWAGDKSFMLTFVRRRLSSSQERKGRDRGERKMNSIPNVRQINVFRLVERDSMMGHSFNSSYRQIEIQLMRRTERKEERDDNKKKRMKKKSKKEINVWIKRRNIQLYSTALLVSTAFETIWFPLWFGSIRPPWAPSKAENGLHAISSSYIPYAL